MVHVSTLVCEEIEKGKFDDLRPNSRLVLWFYCFSSFIMELTSTKNKVLLGQGFEIEMWEVKSALF